MDKREQRAKLQELVKAGNATQESLIADLGLDNKRQLTQLFYDLRVLDLYCFRDPTTDIYFIRTYEEQKAFEAEVAATKPKAAKKGPKKDLDDLQGKRAKKRDAVNRTFTRMDNARATMLKKSGDPEFAFRFEKATAEYNIACCVYDKFKAKAAKDLGLPHPDSIDGIEDLNLLADQLKAAEKAQAEQADSSVAKATDKEGVVGTNEVGEVVTDEVDITNNVATG